MRTSSISSDNSTSTDTQGLNQTEQKKSSSSPAQPQLPDHAEVVIVGGGIIGTSVAYHLAKLYQGNNASDGTANGIVLLEQDRLTSGTTWHAAGLMNAFGSLSTTSTWMRQYTQELYRDILPRETGLSTGFQSIGLVELAADADRLEQYRRVAAFNRYCGVEVHEIGPSEVQSLFPICDTNHDDLLAAFYVPTDGRANPTDATMALAKGARQRGAQILEHCRVVGVETAPAKQYGLPPQVTGVRLEDNGHVIQTNKVVNCAGMWARQFGQACGVHNLPNQAAEHYYLLTEPLSGWKWEDMKDWPVLEDSSRCVYIRPEVGGGLMLGLFERDGQAAFVNNNGSSNRHDSNKVPSDFAFGELQPDWDRMTPYLESALERLVPDIRNTVGLQKLFCGPESFTPDGQPMVGESPELQNYYVAAGLNSLGILTGGGMGHLLADWIYHGHAPRDQDVTCIHVNRFHKHESNPSFRHERAGEVLGYTYEVHYPDHQWSSCRNAKQTALHDQLANNAGAHFRLVSGWESPAWYAADEEGMASKPVSGRPSFGRPEWFGNWEAEHNACRDDVALFDMTFMSKFRVQGRDAGAFLNWLSTAQVVHDIDNDNGKHSVGDGGMITYTQWLNERGTLEADLTVTQLNGAGDDFLVICTDTMHNHVRQHMEQQLGRSAEDSNGFYEHVFITDTTARFTQLNVQGPKSRDLLQQLTSHDLSNDAFAFRNVAEIDLGLARVLCARITYVGELGYELFVPVEQSRHVYEQIVQCGEKYGLRHAGLKALGSLRMEKGYRDYGHDIDNTDTLLECGLGFTCFFDKNRPFVGQETVQAQKRTSKANGGLPRKMVNVLVSDPEPLLHGGEVLWRNGQRVSYVRCASYGHTLGGAVGLSMLEAPQHSHDEETTAGVPVVVNKDFIKSGDWQVEIGDQLYPCQLSFAPFYDPKNLRVKC